MCANLELLVSPVKFSVYVRMLVFKSSVPSQVPVAVETTLALAPVDVTSLAAFRVA
jgi:hypothetical protein